MTSTPAVATITSGATPAAPAAIHGRGPWQLAWARLRRDKVAIGSAMVIVVIVLLALVAPLIAHVLGHSPDMLMRVYAHALPESVRTVTEKIGKRGSSDAALRFSNAPLPCAP